MLHRFYVGNLNSYIDKGVSSLSIREISEISKANQKFSGREVHRVNLPIKDEYLFIEIPNILANNGYTIHFENSSNGEVMFESEPIFPEILDTLIESIRKWIGDTNLENPAWDDLEYLQAIKTSIIQYKGSPDVSTLKEHEIYPVRLLVQKYFCTQIAYQNAKYLDLQAPNLKLNRWEIGDHYRSVSRDLLAEYREIVRNTNRDNGGYDSDDGIINEMPSFKAFKAPRQTRSIIRRNLVYGRTLSI